MTLATSISTTPAHHRFTVEQYHRMIETSVLTEDDKVELLNGELLDMTPVGKEHSGVVDQLADFFHTGSRGRFIVRTQNPISIGPRSEPEPDLAVLQFRPDYYRKSVPVPENVLLLIEVADTSVERDRKLKIPLYASAGIVEAWIVDLNAKSIMVYREPADGIYKVERTVDRTSRISPSAFHFEPLDLKDLFPD